MHTELNRVEIFLLYHNWIPRHDVYQIVRLLSVLRSETAFIGFCALVTIVTAVGERISIVQRNILTIPAKKKPSDSMNMKIYKKNAGKGDEKKIKQTKNLDT